MANINLNNYFRKSTDIKSPVDSSIVINKIATNKERWGDLRLDMQMKEMKERPLNAKESTNDIQRIINEESVMTSIRNIFNTHLCSRLLNPQMRFEIKQYLFEPLTSTKAWFLAYDIRQLIPLYEPRVRVNEVSVSVGNDSCYIIKIKIAIPAVSDKSFQISSLLSQDGYVILG